MESEKHEECRGITLNRPHVWVHGVRHTYGDGVFIAERELRSNKGDHWKVVAREVIPKTLGRFSTGIDQKGRPIYEGDVVEFREFYETPENTHPNYVQRKICFVHGCFHLLELNGQLSEIKPSTDSLFEEMRAYDGEFTVIGSVHHGLLTPTSRMSVGELRQVLIGGHSYTGHHIPSNEKWHIIGISLKQMLVCSPATAYNPPYTANLKEVNIDLTSARPLTKKEIEYRTKQFGDQWI